MTKPRGNRVTELGEMEREQEEDSSLRAGVVAVGRAVVGIAVGRIVVVGRSWDLHLV